MAVTVRKGGDLIGLSTDVKPTDVPNGTEFLEYDTSAMCVFTGIAWRRFEHIMVPWIQQRGHLGKLWKISHNFESVADDAFADLVIEIGAVAMHGTSEATSEGSALIELYEGPTFSGGTDAHTSNRNREVGDGGLLTAFTSHPQRDPTVTDVGTLLSEVYNSGGTGGNSPGGSTEDGAEWIFLPNTKYLFRAVNKKGNNANMSWSISIYIDD